MNKNSNYLQQMNESKLESYYMVSIERRRVDGTKLNIEALGELPMEVIEDIMNVLQKHYEK